MNQDSITKTENMICRQEAFRSHVYPDKFGNLTIGYGYNLDAAKISEAEANRLWPDGISVEEAFALLQTQVQDCISKLNLHIPWFKNLDDVRQSVLANMCFNLGFQGLLGFYRDKDSTLEAVKNGEYKKAADKMLASKWYQQVGSRASTLSEMMRFGKWPTT